jgi:hypothetical protein
LEVFIAIAGVGVTALVVMGMILITPHGVVDVPTERADPQGSNPNPMAATARPPRTSSTT